MGHSPTRPSTTRTDIKDGASPRGRAQAHQQPAVPACKAVGPPWQKSGEHIASPRRRTSTLQGRHGSGGWRASTRSGFSAHPPLNEATSKVMSKSIRTKRSHDQGVQTTTKVMMQELAGRVQQNGQLRPAIHRRKSSSRVGFRNIKNREMPVQTRLKSPGRRQKLTE